MAIIDQDIWTLKQFHLSCQKETHFAFFFNLNLVIAISIMFLPCSNRSSLRTKDKIQQIFQEVLNLVYSKWLKIEENYKIGTLKRDR